jgi:hypothetical protein
MSDHGLRRHVHAPTAGASGSRWAWLAHRPAGVLALLLGLASFVVVALSQDAVWATPALKTSAPGLGAAAILALVSAARREHAAALWLIGLGCAAVAMVLGYVVITALVVGATAILVLLLHAVL